MVVKGRGVLEVNTKHIVRHIYFMWSISVLALALKSA